MLEIKNGRLGLYVSEHLKCNRVMTLGFKGLSRLQNLFLESTVLVREGSEFQVKGPATQNAFLANNKRQHVHQPIMSAFNTVITWIKQAPANICTSSAQARCDLGSLCSSAQALACNVHGNSPTPACWLASIQLTSRLC